MGHHPKPKPHDWGFARLHNRFFRFFTILLLLVDDDQHSYTIDIALSVVWRQSFLRLLCSYI